MSKQKGFCYVCNTETKQKCGRCKALPICSPECMKSAWPGHKDECSRHQVDVQMAKERGMFSKVPGGQPATMVEGDIDLLKDLTLQQAAIYSKYGVEEPPDRNSQMDTQKKIGFFLECLKLNDSSDEGKKSIPMPLRMFMNRRYNNAYSHAVQHFRSEELQMLHRIMFEQQIGSDMKNKYRMQEMQTV